MVRPGQARFGMAWRVVAVRGRARSVEARSGMAGSGKAM
jgi:hypothetical protein